MLDLGIASLVNIYEKASIWLRKYTGAASRGASIILSAQNRNNSDRNNYSYHIHRETFARKAKCGTN